MQDERLGDWFGAPHIHRSEVEALNKTDSFVKNQPLQYTQKTPYGTSHQVVWVRGRKAPPRIFFFWTPSERSKYWFCGVKYVFRNTKGMFWSQNTGYSSTFSTSTLQRKKKCHFGGDPPPQSRFSPILCHAPKIGQKGCFFEEMGVSEVTGGFWLL